MFAQGCVMPPYSNQFEQHNQQKSQLGVTKTNLIGTHGRMAIEFYLYPRLSPRQQTYTNK